MWILRYANGTEESFHILSVAKRKLRAAPDGSCIYEPRSEVNKPVHFYKQNGRVVKTNVEASLWYANTAS